MIQGLWCMYGYSVPPFSECYTRNEQYLTGVESPMYHSMTSNYAQVVHKFLKLIPQIMHLISSVVVQGPWYLYVYTSPLFWECYMRHRSCLIGVDNHIDNSMTSNYTKGTLRCYIALHWVLEERSWIMHFTISAVIQGLWCMYGYTIPPFWECYMRHW